MESRRLLECLDADVARLREVTALVDLTAKVPTCPEWTLADLVHHVAVVYLHKVECMRLGSHPDPWPPAGIADEDPLTLFDRAYAALMAEFAKRDPGSPSFTWYGPDQTVGFWIRRMAQETVIHRVDAELSAGVPVAAIPADLARDGIDEVLVAFVAFGSRTWPDEYASTLAGADGRAVRLETPDASWLVRPTPQAVEVRACDDGAAAAIVRGEPAGLLLWLWNRAGDEAVATSGDADLVGYLRRVMAAGTR